MGLSSPIWLQRRKGGGSFDPASIPGLQQQLFNKLAPAGSTVFDERTNKGSARPVQLGLCYLFDGVNDIVNYGNIANVSGNFSILIRFNTSNVNKNFMEVFGKGTATSYDLFFSAATGKLNFRCQIGGISRGIESTLALANNTDYSAMVRYNGAQLTMFINGVSAATPAACTGAVAVVADPLYLGRVGGGSLFVGKLWDFRVYDTFLSDAEVLSVHNYQAISTMPILWDKCDVGNGTSAFSSVGTVIGTITNATLATFHSTQNKHSFQNQVGFSRYVYLDGSSNLILSSNITIPNTSNWFVEFKFISTTTASTQNVFRSGGGQVQIQIFGAAIYTDINGVASSYISTPIAAYLNRLTRVRLEYVAATNTRTLIVNGVVIGTNSIAPAALSVSRIGSDAGGGNPLINASVKNFNISGQEFFALASSTDLTSTLGSRTLTWSGTAGNWFIPRDESNITLDEVGAPLQFSGEVPYDALLKQSNCVRCDGINDYIDFGNVGTVTGYKGWVKFNATNQNIWTLTNNTNTRLHVAGATLTGGASLTLSNIKTNGSATTAAAAGALLNTLAWVYLECDFTSTSATALRVGCGDGASFGNADFALVQFYSGVSLVIDASCSEGAGLIAYNGANPSLNGTLVNGVAWAKQDVVHQNFTLGFSRYDHASSADILVPYDSNGVPLVITPPAGYTKITDNSAGAYHNGAETLVDFTGDVASPNAVINSWETAWTFNTARINPEFRRTILKSANSYRADRFLAYATALSGDNLTKVQSYISTIEIETELLRNIASGMEGPGGYNGLQSDGIITQQNCRSSHWNESGVALTSCAPVYSGWYMTSTNEADMTNSYTVEASIEYPANTMTRVTWNGSNSRVIAPGENVVADQVAVAIPADAQFWVRTWVEVASAGHRWPLARQRTLAAGEGGETGTGVLTNKVMSGTISTASGTTLMRPSGIVAPPSPGMRTVSEAGFGDSIMSGSSEPATPTLNSRNTIGWCARAAVGIHPCINIGVGGTTLANQVVAGKMLRRIDLMRKLGITHLTMGYGINDSLSYAVLAANLETLIRLCRVELANVKMIYSTLGPQSTQTQGFFTASGQTPVAKFNGVSATHNLLNDLIRTTPFGLFMHIDNADILSTARNSGIFRTGYDNPTAGLITPGVLTVTGIATTTSIPTDNTRATNYLQGGGLLFLTGALAGTYVATSATVNNTGATITVGTPLASAPGIGDTFVAFPTGSRASSDGLHPYITTNAATASSEGGAILMSNNKILVNSTF